MKSYLKTPLLAFVCCGILSAANGAVDVLVDNFDPINYSNWSLSGASVRGASGSGTQSGFYNRNAIYFSGNGTRQAMTARTYDFRGGGSISFFLKIGTSSSFGGALFENADAGEDVVLEYSVSGGTWRQLRRIDTEDGRHAGRWGNVSISFTPTSAVAGSSVRLRWRQLRHSGAPFDHWAIDNIAVSAAPVAVNVTSPEIVSNGGGATASVGLQEGVASVTTVQAVDPDPIGTVSYSIQNSGDGDDFSINATSGLLTFKSPPDFESPVDGDANNVYVVTVIASDGTNPDDTQEITVSVSDVNDNAPVITSNGGESAVDISISENTLEVTTVEATDADTPVVSPIEYSIADSGDGALFEIDSNSGELSFLAAPDYEAPADSDTDNVYVVTVIASDGANTSATQEISVTVENTNDISPVIVSNGGAAVRIDQPDGAIEVLTVVATDADSFGAVSYSIVAGGDGAQFVIDSESGLLSFVSEPSYANPTDLDLDNFYTVTVAASDGSNPDATQEITIRVAPTWERADFAVSSVEVDTLPTVTGEAFTPTVTVVNNGTMIQDAGVLRIWAAVEGWSFPGADDESYVVEFYVGLLEPGESRAFVVESPLTASENLGTYFVMAYVDVEGVTQEWSTEENLNGLSYRITSDPEMTSDPNPNFRANFEISAIELSELPSAGGETFTVSLTVNNKGNLIGDAGVIRIWAAQEGWSFPGVDDEGYSIEIPVGILAPDESASFITETSLTAATEPGTYYVMAYVDVEDITDEWSSEENLDGVPYTILADYSSEDGSGSESGDSGSGSGSDDGPSGPLPALASWQRPNFDITVIELSTIPTEGGESFSMALTVENIGNGWGDAGVLRVWEAHDSWSFPGSEDEGYVAEFTVGVLMPGDSVSFVTETLTAPEDSGNYYAMAYVDAGGITAEWSTEENLSGVSYYIAEIPTALAISEPVGSDWFNSVWFGYFAAVQDDWVYSQSFGFVYMEPTGAAESVWFYSPELQAWLLGGTEFNGFYYNHGAGSWYWVLPLESGIGAWLLNMETGEWELFEP